LQALKIGVLTKTIDFFMRVSIKFFNKILKASAIKIVLPKAKPQTQHSGYSRYRSDEANYLQDIQAVASTPGKG